MSDPTQPNDPVPGDEEPTRVDQPVPPSTDPTRAQPAPGAREPEPVAASTTRTTRSGPPPEDRPSGISTAAAIGIALLVGVIAFLAAFLLFGQDDDDADVATDDPTTQTSEAMVPQSELDAVTQERDELQEQVDQLESEVESLQQQNEELQQQGGDDQGVETVELQDVVGMPVEDVRNLASEEGWDLVEVVPQDAPDDAEPGTVVAQHPEPGTSMLEGSALVVEVPSGGD